MAAIMAIRETAMNGTLKMSNTTNCSKFIPLKITGIMNNDKNMTSVIFFRFKFFNLFNAYVINSHFIKSLSVIKSNSSKQGIH